MSTELVNSGMCATSTVDAFRRTFIAVIGFLALALATATHADSTDDEPGAAAIDKLKEAYLACNRDASSGGFNRAGIMRCSMIYEELKQRAFGGDFLRLLEWSSAQSPAQNAGDVQPRTNPDE